MNSENDFFEKKLKKYKKVFHSLGAVIVILLSVVIAGLNGISETTSTPDATAPAFTQSDIQYHFKNEQALQEHYQKHGIEMGFNSPEEYEQAASAVITNSKALHKLEAEDGDNVYYIEETNEFVIQSPSGIIRTYYNPRDGINYYNRQ